MRAIFAILAILAILTASGCQTTHPDWGKGPITLSPGVQSMLNRYMGTQEAMAFAVTSDGTSGFFVYCPGHHGLDCIEGYEGALDACRRAIKGRIECKILADHRDIVWQGRVTMASDDSLLHLKHLKNAKYCYDNLSKSYYVIGEQCMIQDEEVTCEAYAEGINRSKTNYCRQASEARYYAIKGECSPGDRAVSKQLFDISRSFCRSAAGDYYRANGKCKDGDGEVAEAEFMRETAESVR